MDIPIVSHNINLPGYGMFWVANSISSTILGWNNRRLQEKAHERSIEFQREMERARLLTEDKKIQEEIAFKRRMAALARQYRQKEAATSFCTQMKSIELQAYLQHCWPLDPQLPFVILQETEQGKDNSLPLNVVLLRTPLLPLKKFGGANDLDAELYNNLEYSIMHDDIPYIGNLKYRKDACPKEDLRGGNACIMNIHFLMSQLPTLLIIPQYSNGKMNFKSAVWESQAPRPLIRTLFGIDYSPIDALESKDYQKEVIDSIHTAISIIIGTVRDSYMFLTQGKVPTMPSWLNDNSHKWMKDIVNKQSDFKQFIRQENQNILDALDEKNMPHLLEVYTKEDLNEIKEKVKSNF